MKTIWKPGFKFFLINVATQFNTILMIDNMYRHIVLVSHPKNYSSQVSLEFYLRNFNNQPTISFSYNQQLSNE